MRINEDLLPIIVSATEPTGDNRKHIWIRQTENLMNLNSMFGNANYFTISGNAVTLLKDDTRSWTDVQEGYWGIKLKRGTYTLKLSQVITKIQYGFNGAAAGTANNSDTVTFTVNADDTIVHFKFFAAAYPTTINWFMLNVGSSTKAFTPYVNSNIYILNNNNKYEEMMNDYRTRYYTNNKNNVYTCDYVNSIVNAWGTRDMGSDTITDINNLQRGCSTSISTGSTALNIPPVYNNVSFGGRIYCIAGYAGGHHIQLAFHYLSADFFIRYKFYNNNWTAWRVIKTTAM